MRSRIYRGEAAINSGRQYRNLVGADEGVTQMGEGISTHRLNKWVKI